MGAPCSHDDPWRLWAQAPGSPVRNFSWVVVASNRSALADFYKKKLLRGDSIFILLFGVWRQVAWLHP
jgi:hypothetical protein